MTHRTNKVIKRLLYDQQKQWHNENNWSIFQDHLLSKGVTSYRHPTTATAGLDDKVVFLGDENQINHFNANPADIAKNIVISRDGPQWEQLGGDIDGEAEGDRSGHSVSMSDDGTIVAIGAYGNSNYTGHVRIYKYYIKDGTLSWHQQGEDIDGEADIDLSGFSVSLSYDGSIVAIGAHFNNGANGTDSGHVRIYKWRKYNTLNDDGEFHHTSRSSQTKPIIITENFDTAPQNGNFYWTQVGLDIDGEASNDESGVSLSLSADGTVVAIGARYNDGVNNTVKSGHMRVYEYNGSSWQQRGADIDGEAENDESGYSVSLSANGSIVAIGAINNDDVNGVVDSGHVRVYEYRPYINANDSGKVIITESPDITPVESELYWIQVGQDIDGEAENDNSGYSVSLSADGSILAIGAPNNDGNGNNSGHVRVYQYNTSNNLWNKRGGDIDGEASNDENRVSVSLSADGTILAIGANKNDQNGENSGHVRIYQYDPTKTEGNLNGPEGWNRIGQDIHGEAERDNIGQSVSLNADGSVVAIGASNNNKNPNEVKSGHVRVYQIAKRNPWVQQGLEILGNQIINIPTNVSACSTSISNNGDVIAIGSPYNNDAGLGDRTGHVRIYEKNEGLWKQKGFDIPGEAEEDQTGYSVSLNGNGNFVAVGSPQIYNSNSYGYMCIYEYREYTSNDNDKTVITQYSDTQPEEGEFYWIQVGQVIEKESSDNFIGMLGLKVSLSDDGLIIATSISSSQGTIRVYKYDNTSDEWIKHGGDIIGNDFADEFGTSLSLSHNGSIIAIGAPQTNMNNVTGYVSVFSFNSDKNEADENGPIGWNQVGGVIHGKANGDTSGWSVSLSADASFLAIGAPNNVHNNNDNGPGYVSIYQREPNKTEADENGPIGWNQVGGNIQGEANGNTSGWSVSLSADGAFLAIGAPNNNGNGERSGHTRIYQRAPNKTESDENGPIGWIKVGGNIEGEEANESGASVSLNSDGSMVVIAGPLASDETVNSANPNLRARVYKFTGWGLGSV